MKDKLNLSLRIKYFSYFFQLQQVGRKSNYYSKPVKYVFTVTQGASTTKGSSGGGSSSNSVGSANVGLNIKSVFSAGLGYSHTTSYNWNESSSTSFSKTVSHQIEVDVQPGDTVTVYQVVGITVMATNTSLKPTHWLSRDRRPVHTPLK